MPSIARQTLQPGAVLEGFEVLEVLEQTRGGVLYLARANTDGHTLAIKEYMPSSVAQRLDSGWVSSLNPGAQTSFDRGLHAFLNEALTLAQFEHPHLLHINGVWEANGTAYRSMPHLGGSTLLAHRTEKQPKPMDHEQVKRLLDGLLGALQTLHDGGIAHGLVEPSNIYWLEEQQPVLMDFGSVQPAILSDPTQRHVADYADPQQAPSLMAADVHAAAAVVYFAISGVWPLAGTDGHTHIAEPLADVLERLTGSSSAHGYQPEFLAAVDQILSPANSERPASISELRTLLDTQASSPSGQEPVCPQTQRRTKARPSVATQPASPALSPSESVLALLANFERGPAPAAEHVEPFTTPPLPTLTDEAEPTLAPLRENPFDQMEADDQSALGEPSSPMEYVPRPYTPMPRPPSKRRQQRLIIAAMVVGVIGMLGGLGWLLVN